MRRKSEARATQRRFLDRRLKTALVSDQGKAPESGWLRAVREGLGLSAAQLARRVGVSVSTLLEIEERERAGKVTLQTIRRVAQAMDCDLAYGLVPRSAASLEEIVDARAHRAAQRMVRRATQSMELEKQAVDAAETDAQLEALARSLKEALSPALWDEP